MFIYPLPPQSVLSYFSFVFFGCRVIFNIDSGGGGEKRVKFTNSLTKIVSKKLDLVFFLRH